MVFFQSSSSALILLPDFTISKFEAELCVSSTDLCHLNWLFISWHSQAVVWGVFCLCQLVSAQYGVLTEHTLGSCLLGRWFFFCWENGSHPRLFTGLFTLHHVLELLWKFMRSLIMLLQPKQAYVLQCVFSYSFVLGYCDFL